MIVAVPLLQHSVVTASILHVPGQFGTIQAAIDAAVDGDTVLVEPGIYSANPLIAGKAITLASQYLITNDINYISSTVIDASVFFTPVIKVVNSGKTAVICGFTIRGGQGEDGKGGGIYNSGNTIIGNNIITDNNIIFFNAIAEGGGIYHHSGQVQILGNIIAGNVLHSFCETSATARGAGISSHGDALISGNSINDNMVTVDGVGDYPMAATFGGGIYLMTPANIINNTISNNSVSSDSDGTLSSSADAYGGGVYGPAYLVNNIITGNNAHSSATATGFNPSFSNSGGGGGYDITSSENNLVAYNTCYAITTINNGNSLYGGIKAGNIVNTTITANSLWGGNTVFGGTGDEPGKNNIVFNNSPNNGGTGFTYSYFNDPYFADGPQGSYYLAQTSAGQPLQSPCVDAGDPSSAPVYGTTRTDENPDLGIIDIGFHYPFVTSVLNLTITAMLEGPIAGSAMNPILAGLGMIPLTQPFNQPPWYYPGMVSETSVPANVVDWVLVDLFNAEGIRVGRKAAFISQDGHIINPDGSQPEPLLFDIIYSCDFYIRISHRNHLAIISSESVSYSTGIISYDFSSGPG